MQGSHGEYHPRIESVSESLLIVRLGDIIDVRLNAAVHALAARIDAARIAGVVDVAPAYASVAVRYRPESVLIAAGIEDAFAALAAALGPLLAPVTQDDRHDARVVEIPVCYGGAFGVDLDASAQSLGMNIDAMIAAHAGGDYRVAMLGFAPGFPYLLGLPPELALPRRAEPRLRVPAGSVAIGGAQTGIYPGELPGGWHLIGRTPCVLFDADAASPCLLSPGDRVRFRRIGADEFEALQRASAR